MLKRDMRAGEEIILKKVIAIRQGHSNGLEDRCDFCGYDYSRGWLSLNLGKTLRICDDCVNILAGDGEEGQDKPSDTVVRIVTSKIASDSVDQTLRSSSKKCTQCGKVRPKRHFLGSSTRGDGFSEVCKFCVRNNNRKERKESGQSPTPASVEILPDGLRKKFCKKCGKEKVFAEFHMNAVMKDGRGSWCKECGRSYNREHMRRVRMGESEDSTTGPALEVPSNDPAGVRLESKCGDCGDIRPASKMREYEPMPGVKRKICVDCFGKRFPGGGEVT